MQSNEQLQARNDRHFFLVVGIAIGCAIGFGLATLAGAISSLKDWQPLMASLVAVFAALIALYNVRVQITAGFKKDAIARAADREARVEEARRNDKPYRDCAHLVGQLTSDAFKQCQFVLNTRVNLLANSDDWLRPVTPLNLAQYKGWRPSWDDIYRPLAHETASGLTKMGNGIATTILKLVDRVVVISDAHEKLVSMPYLTAPPDYSQSTEALAIIEQFLPMAEELKRGAIY
ncbi:hypothetical protein BA190_10090 [Labrys sp. WJW]|uniref:hypothetical protein n=1 Tax=Labrys sp. WJW TaxID=1737983 RepID=UPI000833D3F2|nr:hypothetical protein [Labrys sp. WJW]OCC05243.1 hypothetical protein BA190_10090 [Labrys sp. WJW]